MKRIFLITTSLLLFCIGSAFAEVEIKAGVDKNKLTTDEVLTYKLIITSQVKNIPVPQVPKFEGFNIVSQAQSTTVSFIKSKIKNIIVYVFILAPKDYGKFKIEPAQIKFKGKSLQTEAFDIEVGLGKTKPIAPPEEEPNLPPETPEESTPKITL